MRRWLDFLFPPREDERALRGTSADGFLALLAPRLVAYTNPPAVALLPFRDRRVKAALHEAKYRGSEAAFALLSRALGEYLRDADSALRPLVLVPVPLGDARRRERGFNQAEEVARRAAEELGLRSAADLLIRTRETPSQTALSRKERQENVRGAFGAAYVPDPALLYMVFDDVVTTGATLQAAADALMAAGARHVTLLALAH